MRTLISKGNDKWKSIDGITVVEGLVTVTNVENAQSLTVNEVYDIVEQPNNGRNLNDQRLTRIQGSTATFSTPPSSR